MNTSRIDEWTRSRGPAETLDLPLRLTLVILAVRPMGPWFTSVSLFLLAVLGLIHTGVLHAPALWFGAAALVTTHLVLDWPLPDNHHYLLAYWLLGIGIALRLSDPPRALARTAGMLVGLAFLFAVLWKAVLSPEYLDGRFFAVTLLTDERFADLVQLVGGLSMTELTANREYLTALPEGAELLHPPPFHDTSRFRGLVIVLTWGGLVLESAIAALWLAPPSLRRTHWTPHAALLAFCAATYAVAPVAGFGWLLVAMGLSATSQHQPALRVAYVAVFAIVLLFSEMPWTSLLLDMRGP
jgi:hypothetical protein